MGCSRAARLLSMLFLIAAAQKSIASFTGAYMVRMVVELPYDEAGFTSAVQGSFRQAVATATTTTADAVTVNSFAAAAIGRRRLLVAGIDVDFSIAKESEGMADALSQSDKLSLANLNAALESAGLAPTTAIKTGPAVQLMQASVTTPPPQSSRSESKDSEDDQNELVDIGLAIGIVALLVCLGVYPVVRQKREQKQQEERRKERERKASGVYIGPDISTQKSAEELSQEARSELSTDRAEAGLLGKEGHVVKSELLKGVNGPAYGGITVSTEPGVVASAQLQIGERHTHSELQLRDIFSHIQQPVRACRLAHIQQPMQSPRHIQKPISLLLPIESRRASGELRSEEARKTSFDVVPENDRLPDSDRKISLDLPQPEGRKSSLHIQLPDDGRKKSWV
mmetsp:Transcript_1/g.3  ORF Transcript_1/g.3 Transcript_1/m.3 type:complete len:397 (-) Transcript_1:89-1279(-)